MSKKKRWFAVGSVGVVAAAVAVLGVIQMMRPDPYADRKKSLISLYYYGAYCRRGGVGEVFDCTHPTEELCEHEGYPPDREGTCFPRPAVIFCDFPAEDNPKDPSSLCFLSKDECEEAERTCVRVAMGPAPSLPVESGSLTRESVHRVRQEYSGQWCFSSDVTDVITTCVFTDKRACEDERRGDTCVERPDPLVCSYSARAGREGGREVVCHASIDTCRRKLAPQAKCTEVRF